MARFKKIYVEITNICNMHCSFCHKTKRKKEFISIEKFEYIIKNIRAYTDYIYMHIMGEPFLHPELSDLLDICQEYGIKVNITTNGTLIKQVENYLKNKNSLRQINFSLHSFEDNYGFFDFQYLNNIISFAKENNQNMISCLRLWNVEENENVNKHILQNIESEFCLPENYLRNLTKGNGIKIADNIFFQHDRKFKWPDINGNDIFQSRKCFALKDHIGILVNGDVVPCCLDCEGDICLGNIYEKNIEEIINSERALNIINGFRKRQAVEKLCKTCGWNVKE